MSCVSSIAGDFDNDMDVDLFLVCRSGANNLPDRVYENLGNGTFTLVSNSGAEGVVGVGATFGVGDRPRLPTTTATVSSTYSC